MLPLESEAYNIVFENPGLGRGEIHQRHGSAASPSQTVAALQTLQELGKIEQRIEDGKRRYYPLTEATRPQPPAPAPDASATSPAPKTPAKPAASPWPIQTAKPKKQVGNNFLQQLEDEADRARILLEKYLDSLDDPILQALINSANELDAAVEAARARAA
ncbi:MAG: hypothetical protein ACOC0Q_07350 [Wenzhouxiangella sp.]